MRAGDHSLSIDDETCSRHSFDQPLQTIPAGLRNFTNLFERIQNKISPSVRKIGILGVSYKPDVDDARETPVLEIAKILSKQYEVRCHDPLVKDWDFELFPIEKVDGWADVLIILSGHKVYSSKKFDSPLLSFDQMINAVSCEF